MSWELKIDTSGRGDFLGVYDDITEYVLSFRTFRGFAPYERLADELMIEVVLKNNGREFSPENGMSDYYPALRANVLVALYYDGKLLEIGYTQAWQPDTALYGSQQARLMCYGAKTKLQAAQGRTVNTYENITADTFIEMVMSEAQILPPRPLSDGWVLGLPGLSEVGTAKVADNTYYFDADTGNTTIDIIGHNIERDEFGRYDLYTAIDDAVTVEQGWSYQDASGKWSFRNRRGWVTSETVQVTVDNDYNETPYYTTPSAELVNRVSVTGYETNISESISTVVYELQNPISLANGEVVSWHVTPKTNALRAGIKVVKTPNGGDVVWNNGSGTVESEIVGQQIKVTVTGGAGGGTLSTLTLRAQKIDQNEFETVVQDDTLIEKYGLRPLALTVKASSTIEESANIAAFTLGQRSKEQGRVDSVTFTRGAYDLTIGSDFYQRDIGDVVQVIDTQTGHDRNYRIASVSRTYDESAQLVTSWGLTPSPRESLWIVDVSYVGIDTRAGY